MPRGPGRHGQRDGAPPVHAAGDDRGAQPRPGREPLGHPQGRGHLSPSRDRAPGPGPGHSRGPGHRHACAGRAGKRLRDGPRGGEGRRLPLLRLLFPRHPGEALAARRRRGLVSDPQRRHGGAQPPLRPREAHGDPAPLLRRRLPRPPEGLPGILVTWLLPCPARAQGGTLGHDLRPHARLRRRGDRLPLLAPQGPARHPRRAAEHAGLGRDQRRDGVAELPQGRDGHRLSHPRRPAREDTGGGGVRAGHGRGPLHAHRPRGPHAPATPEAGPRVPPGGGRGVASHPALATDDRGGARQPAGCRPCPALRARLLRRERRGSPARRPRGQELRGARRGGRQPRRGRGPAPAGPHLLRGVAHPPGGEI